MTPQKPQHKSFKELVLDMEREVFSHTGADMFEEFFKLIVAKLFDEKEGLSSFTVSDNTNAELKNKVQGLLHSACQKWKGVIKNPQIELSEYGVSRCVSLLEHVELLGSNFEIMDDSFEYLMNKSSKGEKGQYFTPRYIIEMCVRMLNPQAHETLIDTAAGSCGFPLHSIFHVWKNIGKSSDYVREKIFAIDFDERTVRIGRLLTIIAGEGQSNVMHLNTLDYSNWKDRVEDSKWNEIYGEAYAKLKLLQKEGDENKCFKFDILMANPPFAGEIKEGELLSRYELGKNPEGKYRTSVSRDILFIERNLDFLKSGGRMAIILPQGRLNNSSDRHIRDFLVKQCRVLAVIGLHVNVFKPHTGTKTSVILVQKWDEELCPYVEDYPIFFAVMNSPSKTNSGDKIYVKNLDGNFQFDNSGQLIVDHGLYNHEGKTRDGLVEEFLKFAKTEKFHFLGEI